MKISDYQRSFGILKPETMFAGQILESLGYVFGTDYGPTSAIAKATDMTIRVLEEDEDEKYGHAI